MERYQEARKLSAAISTRAFNKISIAYFFLLLLLITEQLVVLFEFGFEYTGNDQTALWLAARNYSQGIFHEPYFYGQNYNFMLESLFAAPFVAVGAKPHLILPVITSLFALTPYLSFSWFAYRKNEITSAFVWIALPLLLPIGHTVLTTVPGGFVSGIFFIGLFPFAFSIKKEPPRFIACGMLLGLAYITNTASLILIAPFGLYLLLNNLKSYRFYTCMLAGIAPFLLIEYFSKQFYIDNPGWLGHCISDWMLVFDFDRLMNAFTKLDWLFRYLAPLAWNNGFIVLVLIFAFACWMIAAKRYKAAAAIFAGLAVLIFSLGFAKTHDGNDSLLFSTTRMFLAVPVLLGLACTWALSGRRDKWPVLITLVVLCIVSTGIKLSRADASIREFTKHENLGPIDMVSIDKLCNECEELNRLARQYNASLLVGVFSAEMRTTYLELRTRGCEMLIDSFPETLNAAGDSRTWRFLEEEEHVHERILFLGGDPSYWVGDTSTASNLGISCISEKPYVHVLVNNTVPTIRKLRERNTLLKRYR